MTERGTSNAASSAQRGPFQVVEEEDPYTSLPAPHTPLFRVYDCPHYEKCLNTSAALDWDNFTCFSCAGEPDQQVAWLGKLAARRDEVAASFFEKAES